MSDSSTTKPPPFKRTAFAVANDKGESVAEWSLTPTAINDMVQIVAQPIYTVPIIFVPGIMGSNLKLTEDVGIAKKGKPVWLLNGTLSALGKWPVRNPAERQILLNPATTEVHAEGAVPDFIPTIGDANQIRSLRYWGEVGAMSYQSYLVWLEKTLNQRRRHDEWQALVGQPAFATALSKGYTFQTLEDKDLGHAVDMRFPVYACGYNWLQSNSESAKRLATRIDEVIAANNSKSFTCDQVILITHSMGGLVARACSELLGKRSKIAGIVHGVMPATGAAVAYKRVRTGTEGAAGIVIGDDAAKVTAVFANSPGALQLLPSQHYGTGWLQLGMGTGNNFKVSCSLPIADPYSEIYEQRGKWWGLVREELINPAELEGHLGWDSYLDNIHAAKKFHTNLGHQYHANTIAFYGDGTDDTNGKTWGKVRWECSGVNDMSTVTRGHTGHAQVSQTLNAPALLALPLSRDEGNGALYCLHGSRYRYDFTLSGKDSVGDGTVPAVSGAAPATAGQSQGVQASYHLSLDAEGHEGAYRIPLAQQLSVHAVLSIAKKIKVKI